MFNVTKSCVRPTAKILSSRPSFIVRALSTSTATCAGKKEGDISSVFVSLSGAAPEALPERFANIKRQLVKGHESALTDSWQRLIKRLATENEEVARNGPNVIPSIEFSDLGNPSENFISKVKHRGVAVVRGVIPENEARGYKTELQEYVKLNPSTKGDSPLARHKPFRKPTA
jgi:hypothetical protein